MVPRNRVVAPGIEPRASNPEELRKHIIGTYAALRIGMVVIGLTLPIILYLGGRFIYGLKLQGSMSAYYETPMRDLFVGGLWAIGGFLILYRGYGDRENWLLNFAGVCSILVAQSPLNWYPEWNPLDGVNPHGVFAILFFIFITLVCLINARDTLSLIKDDDVKKKYKLAYIVIGMLMILFPIITLIRVKALGDLTFNGKEIYFLEGISAWLFAIYWALKSYELHNHTKAEEKALNFQVSRNASGIQEEPEEESERFHRAAVEQSKGT